jgi:transportin-1
LRRSIDFIVPRLIQLCTDSTHPRIKIYALTCYNLLISYEVPAAFEKLDAYLQCLFKLASDQVGDIRALVCKAFVTILDVAPEVLLPHLASIGDFMMFSMQVLLSFAF